jgi:mannose-6-phosphate isomerase
MRGVSVLSKSAGPFRLKPQMVERVWGFHNLAPWYEFDNEQAGGPPIGEAWLSGDDCVIETGPLAGKTLGEAVKLSEPALFTGKDRSPLLIKYLFPKEKLSVQVHPDDANAARIGNGAEAKTECWYVLEAQAGSSVAMGLKPGTQKDAVLAAIQDETLESLLEYPQVAAGDMMYVAAGTIHAILPGVVILEIQQNSDTTYRLYDYGRPRPLHLELGMEVLKLTTDAGLFPAKAVEGGTQLISVPHFTVERYELSGESKTLANQGGEYLVTLKGEGKLTSEEGEVDLIAGELVVVPAAVSTYSLQGAATVVRSFAG